jgi:hypothetical protein
MPRANIGISPDSEKFVIQQTEVKPIAMPGIDDGVENFNVEDEEVPRDTIV